MPQSFGPHAALVEQFLDEVRQCTTGWPDIAARADNPGQRPAVAALTRVSWPAAVLSAVDKAALRAYGSLGLTRADFDDPFALGTIKVAISAAAKAIAVQDKLAREHVEELLRPFADEGFPSAVSTLSAARPT
ncbi:hypothetical protein [Cellulomonas sp. URHB0016]